MMDMDCLEAPSMSSNRRDSCPNEADCYILCPRRMQELAGDRADRMKFIKVRQHHMQGCIQLLLQHHGLTYPSNHEDGHGRAG